MRKLPLISVVLISLSMVFGLSFTGCSDRTLHAKVDGKYLTIQYNKLKGFTQKEDFQFKFKNIDVDTILLISFSPVLSNNQDTFLQAPNSEIGSKEIVGVPTIFRVEPDTESKIIHINSDFLDKEIENPKSKLLNWKVSIYLLKELAVRPVIKPKLLLGHKSILPHDLPNSPVILSDTIEKAAFNNWPLEKPDFLDVSDSRYGYYLYYQKDKLLEKINFSLK